MTDPKLDALQREFNALTAKIEAEASPVKRVALKRERAKLSARLIKMHQALVRKGMDIKAPRLGPAIGKPNPDYADGADEEDADE